MYAGAELLLAEAALFEVFVEQRVVTLGDVLDELLVQRGDFVLPLTGGGFFFVKALAVRFIGDDFATHHVEDLMKTRTAPIDGNGEREDTVMPVVGASIFEHLVK